MTIYVFSGLGADERVFKSIQWPYEPRYIKWNNPPKEYSLKAYATELAKQIQEKEVDVFIGLSFGGIMAQEMSKIIPAKKIILISSVTCRKEIPSLYRFLGLIKFPFLIPAQWLQKNPLIPYFFGIKNEKDRRLLRKILNDTDLVFLKWAIISMLKWQQEEKLPNTFQILGEKDKIIRPKNIQPDVMIPNAGHFMIVDHAQQVQDLIHQEINSLKA